jgi:branched-chain amino acid aminotransferase
MPSPLAYLNGRLLPFSEARLSLADLGFVSGTTIVDNARTFRHKLFRWPDHLARFRRDCEACFVPLEASDKELAASAEELVAHNATLLPPAADLQLVTFATPGPLGIYSGCFENGPPTLGMATYPLPVDRYRRLFGEGATLALEGTHPSTSTLLPPRIKHRSRLAWYVADCRARARTGNPAALAVPLASPGGTLTETSIGHFLLVHEGVVTIPPRALVLDGISLRVLEELCRAGGIPFAERDLPIDLLPRGSEAMLTGTGFSLVPVREVWPEVGAPIRFMRRGPVFSRLLRDWSDLVGVDIEGQFTGS